jgi:hypothetical protein
MTNLAGPATVKPKRISISSLKTGETYKFPYIPEKFKESVKALYNRQNILGMSHQNMQYSHTENHSFDGLTFVFRANNIQEINYIHEGRKFLLSLMYPYSGGMSVREGAPSRVLLLWPNVISMTCVIEQVEITHKEFNSSGKTTLFEANLKLTEIRDTRLLAEDVRFEGTQRAGNIAQQFEDLQTSARQGIDYSNLPEELE